MKALIALLTAATGILHLLVGFDMVGGSGATYWILVLNGVGYLVLLWLFWTSSGSRRGTIRWILLAYTLITFIGYFALNAMNGIDSFANPMGLIIKAIELLLIDVYKRQSMNGSASSWATTAWKSHDAPGTRSGEATA